MSMSTELRPVSERPRVGDWVATKWKDGGWSATHWVSDHDFSAPFIMEGWLLLSRAEPKSLSPSSARTAKSSQAKSTLQPRKSSPRATQTVCSGKRGVR